MPSNKERLYLSLYARSGKAKMPGLEDTYHWALIVGPKDCQGPHAGATKYHAKEKLVDANGQLKTVWQFEELDVSMLPAGMLLARIVIAKVADRSRLVSVLRSTPIRTGTPGWNCVAWIREALDILKEDGNALGTATTDWSVARDAVMEYVERKKAEHRFDGKGSFDASVVPTWDLLQGRELIC